MLKVKSRFGVMFDKVSFRLVVYYIYTETALPYLGLF